MELRQYANLLLKWLWLIILGTVLAGGTAYVVSSQMAPVYRATTTLYISPGSTPLLTEYSSLLSTSYLQKTYAALIVKRPVMDQVLAQLHLTMTPKQWASMITVTPVRDTQLLAIAVESTDPAQAAAIANAVADVFIKQTGALQTSRFTNSKQNLLDQLATIQGDIDKTTKAIEEKRNSSGTDVAAQQAEVARLETTLSGYRNSYSSVLTSYENLRVTEAQSGNSITVAEPAVQPSDPVRPSKRSNTLLAAIVGAMLATGVAFLIEYLDDTIKTPADAEQIAGLATLGTIGLMTDVKAAPDSLITSTHPKSSIAEGYRMMRTMLQFANDGSEKDFLVTSAGPQEGKTTTVANLGVVLAQAGRSTIVVDADLRRPSLHKIFGVQNMRGLTTLLLRDDLDVASVLLSTGVDGLKVLPSGIVPPNPAELLEGPRLDKVIARLKELADVVIYDSPPVLAVADTSILAGKIKRGLVVTYTGHTRSDDLRRAKDALAMTGIVLQGIVLNRTHRRRGGYGYYGYYDYYSEDGDKEQRRRKKSGFSLPFFKRGKKAQPDEAPKPTEG